MNEPTTASIVTLAIITVISIAALLKFCAVYGEQLADVQEIRPDPYALDHKKEARYRAKRRVKAFFREVF